jgi:hypothetical protein
MYPLNDIELEGIHMGKADASDIAYCGLYCGQCPSHLGRIADLSRDLRKELRDTKFDKMAESLAEISFFRILKGYGTCYEVLGAMVKMRCHRMCKGGGGPPFCKMRKCCEKKGYDGCWECDDFETCEHLDFLVPGHGDAHIKNLRLLKRKGVKEFKRGKHHWFSTPKKKR